MFEIIYQMPQCIVTKQSQVKTKPELFHLILINIIPDPLSIIFSAVKQMVRLVFNLLALLFPLTVCLVPHNNLTTW